jgi:adenosylhomocysteine nucleosidase
LTADLLQVALPPSVRADLCQLAVGETSKHIRQGLLHENLAQAPIQVAPMVSGSQVVADNAVFNIIGDQGRKVTGIDMEVASVFFAGNDFFDGGGIFCAAKAIVDLANPHKDDRYHEYGCALSARFVVTALSKLLSRPE